VEPFSLFDRAIRKATLCIEALSLFSWALAEPGICLIQDSLMPDANQIIL
jgi:hypothetical protein